jgi:type III secretion system HrpE/YscL family protein
VNNARGGNVFVKRQIKIPVSEQVVIGPLLKAHTIKTCLDGEDIIQNAHKKAADIIAEANNKAERITKEATTQAELAVEGAKLEAERQVLAYATSMINDLQQSEEQLWSEVEASASRVLQSALASILDDTSLRERIGLLVQRLVETQKNNKKGVLYCSATTKDLVEDVLAQQNLSFWSLEVDTSLKSGDLRLETEMGLFSCSWEAFRQAMVIEEN